MQGHENTPLQRLAARQRRTSCRVPASDGRGMKILPIAVIRCGMAAGTHAGSFGSFEVTTCNDMGPDVAYLAAASSLAGERILPGCRRTLAGACVQL